MSVENSIAEARRTASGYLELFRTATMSGGIYVLPAGARDRQTPHTEEEVYVVLRGRGRFFRAGRTVPVHAGDHLLVAAGEVHRFEQIEEELVLFVFFSPPEGSVRRPGPPPG